MKTEDHLPVPFHLREQFLSVEGQYVDRRNCGRLLSQVLMKVREPSTLPSLSCALS